MNAIAIEHEGSTHAQRSESEEREYRDRMITDNLGLVHHIARKLGRNLNSQVELDDLVAFGTIGLMKAVPCFKPELGIAFSTYAAPRIRGAILDELRRQDHAPRSIRRKGKALHEARRTLSGQLLREPRDVETAEYLGVDVGTVWKWDAAAERHELESLDHLLQQQRGDRKSISVENLAAGEFAIDDAVDREEVVQILREALMELKEQERLVLTLHYFEELKLSQIATLLEVTPSRISQIHSRGLAKLRDALGPALAA